MPTGISTLEYHEQTKHTPQSVRRGPEINFDNKPRPYKIYQNLPRVPLETVDTLCYDAAGVTKTLHLGGREHEFRAAACTDALYHIDLYPVCGDLDGGTAAVSSQRRAVSPRLNTHQSRLLRPRPGGGTPGSIEHARTDTRSGIPERYSLIFSPQPTPTGNRLMSW
jgi:hypothetical protein